MVIRNGQIIPAFPIHHKTIRGTQTDLPVGSFVTIHCLADCVMEYTFKDGSTFTENLIIGEDRALGDTIATITSTGEIIVS